MMDARKHPKSFYTRTPVPTFRRRLLHGRTANFNSIEKRHLVQLVDPYKDIVDSKKNDVTTVKEKENIWNHVTRLFNARFAGQKPREPRNLQRLWKNIKSKAKAQNSGIDAMLDSEDPKMILQSIKIENQSDGFHESEGQEISPAHIFPAEDTKVVSSFKYSDPKSCQELPTLVQMSHGGRESKSPTAENGAPSSTSNTIASDGSTSHVYPVTSDLDTDALPGSTFKEDECRVNGFEAGDTTARFDTIGAENEFEDNLFLMQQVEHEQKMKNLRYEHEMKREEHDLRMNLLKEEVELVRLRKELLKRQLESCLSVMNA